MAIYEFRGSFLPYKSIQKRFGFIPKCLSEYSNGFQDECTCFQENHFEYQGEYNYWDTYGIDEVGEELKKRFSCFEKSWSESAEFFGYEKGLKIELWRSDDAAIDIDIDLRNFSESFLGEILAVADHYNCVYVEGDTGQILKPKLEEILGRMVESKRYKIINRTD